VQPEPLLGRRQAGDTAARAENIGSCAAAIIGCAEDFRIDARQ
jgi:hypothetical protein